MKALVWKDFRQNGNVLIAVGVFVVIPYLIVLCIVLVKSLRADAPLEHLYLEHEHWVQMFGAASLWSLGLSLLTVAFLAGNAVAGERADRSAHFAAYLPISRRASIASKAMLAIGAYLVVWIVNLAIELLACKTASGWFGADGHEALGFMVVTAVLVFGVAWLFSCLISSPGLAAAAGIAAPMVVGGTLAFVDFARGLHANDAGSSYRWHIPLCLVLGAGCFAAGVAYFLRRVEA